MTTSAVNNKNASTELEEFCAGYADRLSDVLRTSDWSNVAQLGLDMQQCWLKGKQVFFCGNGGSAGNAIHLANDFVRHCQEHRRRVESTSSFCKPSCNDMSRQ